MQKFEPVDDYILRTLKKNLQYQERIIAFIDILGFKDIIKNSESDPGQIEAIYAALEYLKTWEIPDKWDLSLVEVEEDAQKKGVERFDIRSKTNTTAFSDSIVISVTTSNDINAVMSTLVANLAYIGANLLEKGILFRGGITVGNIIHSNNGIVFGQGLIDAYLLESKSSKYPRIILSNKLIKKLNYPIEEKRNRYPYHHYLVRFEDGCVGFHQMMYYQALQSWDQMTPEIITESLDKIRKTVLRGLDASFEHPDVYEKYAWLKVQYNNLIILDERFKIKIREINEDIAGQNIHYSYTDQFYESRRNQSSEEIR